MLEDRDPAEVVRALAPQLTDERRARIEDVLSARLASLAVVIEDLHDPHNGAAAIRSAEGFGVCELHAVEKSEPFRFSSRVTQGCEKWIDVHRHAEFAPCADSLHARGFKLYAAVPGAALRLDEIPAGERVALVFGNEHAGLTTGAQAACDGTFGIPMLGFTRSFNLSVSVALAVYDVATRKRAVLGAAGDLDDAERLRLRARWYALSMDARAAEGIVLRERVES
jgi:tRNA (guanosine-2'-O-)-methyltransferase